MLTDSQVTIFEEYTSDTFAHALCSDWRELKAQVAELQAKLTHNTLATVGHDANGNLSIDFSGSAVEALKAQIAELGLSLDTAARDSAKLEQERDEARKALEGLLPFLRDDYEPGCESPFCTAVEAALTALQNAAAEATRKE